MAVKIHIKPTIGIEVRVHKADKLIPYVTISWNRSLEVNKHFATLVYN